MSGSVAETALAVGLVAAIIATGNALVTSMHDSHRLFQELELLKLEEDRLQDDWTALQLEAHTLGGHSRIDQIARGDLGMVEPGTRLNYMVLPR